uniref:Uncharacterized protein n=1 Tax=Tanacetum cinerariifolium TaxID=118510 RepID=A0A699H4H0_TANCI|nr:hypothetical protein [Tanacetum cinerariifolium]
MLSKDYLEILRAQDVLYDDNEMVEVKVLMALVDDESDVVGKKRARIDSFRFGKKDLVFIKSSADYTNVSKLNVEIPWLFEAKGFNLPNYDTGRILSTESHMNITVLTDCDSAEESTSICNTSLPLLEKLLGAETQTKL